jgi:hypothetical protein
MNIRRTALAASITAAAALALAGCTGTPSAQKQENAQQQSVSQNVVNGQPIPNVTYSQMRQNLIEIETAQAKGVQTTSFFFQQGNPKPIRVCPSIGVPIPNTASLSNPEQMVSPYGSSGGTVTVPQMDPNGVYAPATSEGTYVVCVDGNGGTTVAYWEGPVETEFGPATWDDGKGQIVATGPATFQFSKGQGR